MSTLQKLEQAEREAFAMLKQSAARARAVDRERWIAWERLAETRLVLNHWKMIQHKKP